MHVCLKVTVIQKDGFIESTIIIHSQDPWRPCQRTALFHQLILFTNCLTAALVASFFSLPSSPLAQWLSQYTLKSKVNPCMNWLFSVKYATLFLPVHSHIFACQINMICFFCARICPCLFNITFEVSLKRSTFSSNFMILLGYYIFLKLNHQTDFKASPAAPFG